MGLCSSRRQLSPGARASWSSLAKAQRSRSEAQDAPWLAAHLLMLPRGSASGSVPRGPVGRGLAEEQCRAHWASSSRAPKARCSSWAPHSPRGPARGARASQTQLSLFCGGLRGQWPGTLLTRGRGPALQTGPRSLPALSALIPARGSSPTLGASLPRRPGAPRVTAPSYGGLQCQFEPGWESRER